MCLHWDLLVITKGDIPQDQEEIEDDRNTDFHDHLLKLDVVLQKLRNKGLQVNVRKSNFAAEEIDNLRYTLSCKGIQPQQQKRLAQSLSLLCNHLRMLRNYAKF